MSETEILKIIHVKLRRAKAILSVLPEEDKLSKHGFNDVGYNQGIITTCEDLLDLITPDWEVNETIFARIKEEK